MLTVVIDTNVMMVALSPRSNLHWLYPLQKGLRYKKDKSIKVNASDFRNFVFEKVK